MGETERTIRLIFQRAREKASEGTPVIVFFDEMDSVFRTRGTGVSSDVETTIVPQLLSEIDGVEGLENVIVIGASNREDMIDPAILRPGRLDVKIKIERPDAEAARDIFSKYLITGLPIHEEDLAEFGGHRGDTIAAMIQHTVERMYSETDENRFLEVTYANGDKEVLYFKDFNSGAMIQNIVDRAKKAAIKARIENGSQGLRVSHLLDAIVDEFAENEDLPNTTNPDDWARISGKKGSGSSTSGPWCRASSRRVRGRSTRRRTPASTCRRERTSAAAGAGRIGGPATRLAAAGALGARVGGAGPSGVHHNGADGRAGPLGGGLAGQHVRRVGCRGRGRRGLGGRGPLLRPGGGVPRRLVHLPPTGPGTDGLQ